MKELKRLLDEDPACVGKYEFLHYKESEDLNFSEVILQTLKKVAAQERAQPCSANIENISAHAEIVEDSVKKRQ